VPCTGDLPTYTHGFLRVSEDKRYLAHTDGTPFFWLGDTHWQAPDRETMKTCTHPTHEGKPCPHGGQFQHLVQDRKAKGFTVYQLYPHIGSGHWWAAQFDRIDPVRFKQEFDPMMDYLAAQGIVTAMGLGHWGAPKGVAEEDLKRWARYIVARYGAHPIVWITAQEADMQQEVLKTWHAVAREIHRVDGYGHPLSYHQHWGVITTWWDEDWHDWGCTQGGHRNVKLRSKKDYRSFWDYTPHKPWLESESNYEAMTACAGPHSAAEVRHAAWKSMLCGSFGYTYGGSGVWLLGRNAEDVKSPWIDHIWSDGMNLPGSAQMGVLKRFYTQFEWWRLTPRWNDPAWGEWRHPEESVLSSIDSNLYVVYFYHESTEMGVLKHMDPKSTYTASWIDPCTGEYAQIGDPFQPADGQWTIPAKPDAKDWVLLMQRTN
jgi:Protein of unknown function (DUF4038)/Putative collagen-binding domain of a collagenase